MIKQAKTFARVISQMFLLRRIFGKLAVANRGARHLSLAVRLQNPNDLDKAVKMAENIALAASSKNVLVQRDNGLVVYQFELSEDYWQFYTRQDLPSNEAIGLAEQRKPINFTFNHPHALVAGATDSGKSETVKSILLSLMTTYSPDELRIILCDLHGDYGDFNNEAHLIIPIATSQDEIGNALLFANQELVKRKRQSIKDGPKLIIVIDEADKILSDERLVIVQSLAQEGRKFNIHIIVATQKPSHSDLPKILDNLNNRYIGLVSDAKISANLTGKSGLQCHLLTGKGDFIHTSGIDTERFQVAQAIQSDFDNLERGEIRPVIVKEPELVLLPEKSVGRPPLKVQPDILPYYWLYGPDNISQSQAAGLGITFTNHKLHKDFCWRFAKKYLELRQSR